MQVSVVIPSKDRCELLRRTLPTYLGQPEVSQVVVVVDGSADGSTEMLSDMARLDPRLTILVNQTNKGTPFSKNKGIEHATSQYIFIGEDDVELTDGYFSLLFQHMRSVGADLVSGRNIWRFSDESASSAIRRSDAGPVDYNDLSRMEVAPGAPLDSDMAVPMSGAPVLGKAEIFRTVRFDERYKVNFWREETDFQISAQEVGYLLAYCPHAVSFNLFTPDDRSGSHAASGLRRIVWMTINNWRFVSKHQAFISQNFCIGSRWTYIVKFFAYRVWFELIIPVLVRLWRNAVSIRRVRTDVGPK